MIPQTEIELENWMKSNCYNFNSYSINGNFIWEGFGIERNGPLFHWYYTERGEKNILETFRTEQEIIAFVYNQLKTDKWAKTHCIGFGFDKTETEQLANILNEMNIEYFQDQIPYYPDKPAYRTFILGCDILKVENLKTKYYNPPQ
jgi:hypothetical protein